MAEVFDSTPEKVPMHLRNIFASGELEADATAKEFSAVRTEGRRRLKHSNLDAIISVAALTSSSGSLAQLTQGSLRIVVADPV